MKGPLVVTVPFADFGNQLREVPLFDVVRHYHFLAEVHHPDVLVVVIEEAEATLGRTSGLTGEVVNQYVGGFHGLPFEE